MVSVALIYIVHYLVTGVIVSEMRLVIQIHIYGCNLHRTEWRICVCCVRNVLATATNQGIG